MKIIVLHDAMYGIAKNGKQMIHITEDLRWFSKLTKGHTVVMGRITAEQLPGGKPLKDRTNIVLTRSVEADWKLRANGFETDCLINYGKWPTDTFVIGGANLYNQVLSEANLENRYGLDEIFGTVVLHDFNCDKQIHLNLSVNPKLWRFERLSDVKLHVSADGVEYPYFHYRLTRKAVKE